MMYIVLASMTRICILVQHHIPSHVKVIALTAPATSDTYQAVTDQKLN